MEHLIENYIKIDASFNADSYYGFLEKNGILLLAFASDENLKCDTKLSKIIVEQIAKNFLDYSEFSKNYLKNTLFDIYNLIVNYSQKNQEIKKYEGTMGVLISDGSEYIVALVGDYELCHKNMKLTNEDKVYLSSNESIKVDIKGPYQLEENDEIILKNKDKFNSTIFISKIKTKKIKKVFTNKTIILLIFIFLFLIALINRMTVNRYDSKIDKLNNRLAIYLKNGDVLNIDSEINSLESLYFEIYSKKYIFMPKKMNKKILDNKVYISSIKDELGIIKKIKEDMALADKYIETGNLEEAKKIYYSIHSINLEKIKTKNLKREIELNLSKIEEFSSIENKMKYAEEYIEKKELKKAMDEYLEIQKIYEKYGILKVSINEKIKAISDILEKEYIELNNLLVEAELFSNTDYKKSINIYLDLIQKYEKIGDIEKVDEVKNKIKNLEDLITEEKLRAKSLIDEALIYAEEKKYKTAIDALINSNEILKKASLDKEIQENNKKIRKYKIKLKENLYEKKEGINVAYDNRAQVVSSINSSIKKGDEYMRNNEWDNAIVEYERAINFSKKTSISSEKLSKLNKKLAYAIKKSKGSWWNVWK